MSKKIILVGLLLLLILFLPSKASAVDSTFITNGHLVFVLTYRVHENPYNEYLQIGHYDFLPGGSLTTNYYLYNAGLNRQPTSTGKINRFQLDYPNGQACNASYTIPTPEGGLTQKNGSWSFDPAGNKITISLDNIGSFEWTLQDNPTQYYTLSGVNIANYANHSIGLAYLTKSPVVTDQPLNKNSLYDAYGGVLYQNNGTVLSDWSNTGQGASFAHCQSPYDTDILSFGYPCNDGTGFYCGYHYLLNNNSYTKNVFYQKNGHDWGTKCMDSFGHSSILFGTLENGKIARSVMLEASFEYDGYPVISIGSWYAPAAPPLFTPTPTPTPIPPPPPLQSASFANNTIAVTFNNPYATISDWIGFYNPTTLADSEWGQNWKWLNNTKTQPSTPITSGTVTFSPPANGIYDVRYFYTTANQKIDSKTVSVTLFFLPGDLDKNGKVDIFDYSMLITDFSKTGVPGFSPADIDQNGKVDIFDYSLLITNFGKSL